MQFLTILIWIAAILAGGWVFRFAGQKVPWPRESYRIYFRDMSYLVAVGFALRPARAYWAFELYFIRETKFFQWAAQGVIGFAILGYLFRFAGRNLGTEGSRKVFRQMPVTAAFGLFIIAFYVIVAVFARSHCTVRAGRDFRQDQRAARWQPRTRRRPEIPAWNRPAWSGPDVTLDLRCAKHCRDCIRHNVPCFPPGRNCRISGGDSWRMV